MTIAIFLLSAPTGKNPAPDLQSMSDPRNIGHAGKGVLDRINWVPIQPGGPGKRRIYCFCRLRGQVRALNFRWVIRGLQTTRDGADEHTGSYCIGNDGIMDAMCGFGGLFPVESTNTRLSRTRRRRLPSTIKYADAVAAE
jgi:hypothetical protein